MIRSFGCLLLWRQPWATDICDLRAPLHDHGRGDQNELKG
jgi:hypothetical protein